MKSKPFLILALFLSLFSEALNYRRALAGQGGARERDVLWHSWKDKTERGNDGGVKKEKFRHKGERERNYIGNRFERDWDHLQKKEEQGKKHLEERVRISSTCQMISHHRKRGWGTLELFENSFYSFLVIVFSHSFIFSNNHYSTVRHPSSHSPNFKISLTNQHSALKWCDRATAAAELPCRNVENSRRRTHTKCRWGTLLRQLLPGQHLVLYAAEVTLSEGNAILVNLSLMLLQRFICSQPPRGRHMTDYGNINSNRERKHFSCLTTATTPTEQGKYLSFFCEFQPLLLPQVRFPVGLRLQNSAKWENRTKQALKEKMNFSILCCPELDENSEASPLSLQSPLSYQLPVAG